jgi:hypothetical protein
MMRAMMAASVRISFAVGPAWACSTGWVGGGFTPLGVHALNPNGRDYRRNSDTLDNTHKLLPCAHVSPCTLDGQCVRHCRAGPLGPNLAHARSCRVGRRRPHLATRFADSEPQSNGRPDLQGYRCASLIMAMINSRLTFATETTMIADLGLPRLLAVFQTMIRKAMMFLVPYLLTHR